MKKIFIRTAFLLILLNSSLFAQWKWQNPLPTGNDLTSVDYVSENKIIAVGLTSTVLVSEDNGLTWRIVESEVFGCDGDYADFSDVFFIDENTGWIVSLSGGIYRSGDGGENWEKVYANRARQLYSINFADHNTGWAVGAHGMVLKTMDGGITWKNQEFVNKEELTLIFCFSPEIVFIQSNNGIYKSNDGGQAWVKILTKEFIYPGESQMYFINENTGWFVGEGKILKTTNGGDSWETIYTDYSISINTVTFLNEETGWAGCSSIILKTTDSGQTWQEVFKTEDVFDSPGLRSMIFKDSYNGIVVGNDGRILRTTDGGGSWEYRTGGYFKNFLYAVEFIDDNRGWAGGFDTFVRTMDGGKTWTDYMLDSHMIITDIDFINDSNGWFVGHGSNYFEGVIYRTSDGGDTWIDITPGQIAYLNAVQFLDENTGYAVGEEGTVLKTTDAGETWTVKLRTDWKIPPLDLEFTLSDLFFLNSDTGWICGDGGYIAKTTDGGNSWQETIIVSGTLYFTEIQFIDELTGWISSGVSKHFFKTTDGGKNWNEIYLPLGHGLESFFFLNKNDGWGGGYNEGCIYNTSDGGETWEIEQDLISNRLTDMVFIDSNTGWVVGRAGAILKYTNPNGTTIEPVADEYILANNYPNPFNPVTTIEFYVPKTLQANVKIYNILGQEVANIYDHIVYKGFHSIEWDASGIVSGIYFCRISTPKSSKTIKITFVK